jgi:valyl-tRNA synthetase
MDLDMTQKVRTFIKLLFDQNLIYKNLYIINWCPRCETAISDEEVNSIKKQSELYYLKYKLADKDEYLIIATTRPETIFGDVAIAYHPDDIKYNQIKSKVIIPIINKEISLIADDKVDQNFGSGLVKITPCHDKFDYELGKRHDLPHLMIIDKQGKIFNTNTDFDGKDRFLVRKLVIKKLIELDLLDKKVNHNNSIDCCYRCETVIEPYLSEQWFVKMFQFKDIILKSLDNLNFYENYNKKILENWFNKDVDWCISRDLVYGHKMPVWKCNKCSKYSCSTNENLDNCNYCLDKDIIQEPFILDTWFSSGLWAYSVFRTSEELEYYFPSNVMITGKDILFFWVAKMVISSVKLLDQIPFKDIILHGVIRSANGEKMSKSKGNIIDPNDLIKNIGADATRFTLYYLTPTGEDSKISLSDFDIGKQFCKKLWNIWMFISGLSDIKLDNTNYIFNNWIIFECHKTENIIKKLLEIYDFRQALITLQYFVKTTFCNEYIEFVKSEIKTNKTVFDITIMVFKRILIMLHPFIPFITEGIWQDLNGFDYKKSILDERFEYKYPDTNFNENYIIIYKNIIEKIRLVKQKYKLGYKNSSLSPVIISNDNIIIDFLSSNKLLIIKLVKLNDLIFNNKENEYIEYFLDLVGNVAIRFDKNELEN